MTNPVGRGLGGRFRRAVGMEALAGQLAELADAGDTVRSAIAEAVAHLQERAAEDRAAGADEFERRLVQALQRTEQSLHQTLAHLDERAAALHAGVLATLRGGAEEAHAVAAHLEQRVDELLRQHRAQNRVFARDDVPSALAVKQYYLQLKATAAPLDFDEVGLSVFSQNGEDGILLNIFAIIGMTTKRCIEIGCDLSGSTVGVPEGNTINLICHFGFDGLIVEMDPDKTAGIRHFFARALTTKHYHRPAMNGRPADYFSPSVVTAAVDVGNIDAVFTGAGFAGEIDLLSIDVDGPDLSLWRAVHAVSPRVVIIEVNNRLAFESLVDGDYSTSSALTDTIESQQSRSSSLGAICRLGEEKGYVFVGMDTTLLNAFFVRRDAWNPRLPTRAPGDYTRHRLNPLLDRSP